MKADIYRKSAKDWRILPNLDDYDVTRATFSWVAAKKELDWFDGKINAAYNAVDRHTHTWRKNKVALYWEGEDGTVKKFTFEELTVASNKVGNILKDFGVQRGDRIFLFLPRIPALFFSFLGVVKIGALAGTL
ncbi:MAG: AMP-binding protein, partial [Patescibacteria group bacterium]